MSFFSNLWRKSTNPRLEHEKAWKRAEALVWDPKWQALSTAARAAYLNLLKPPASSIATTQPTVLLEKVSAPVADELVAAGFARIDPGVGKKGSKILAVPATQPFSARLRALQKYQLLGPTNRALLTNYVKYAFHNQGLAVVGSVLATIDIEDLTTLDEALELYVTSSQWPDWAVKAIKTKTSATVLEALRKAGGPVRLADLPGLVKGVSAKELAEALTDLVTHLAVFEDLKPKTLEIVVGLLPIVRERRDSMADMKKTSTNAVCENPQEIGPVGGLAINDLRVFLLEVAGNAPRLRQDGMIFAKEESRFFDAFPPQPTWLETLLKLSPERRLDQSFLIARSLGFTEVDQEDRSSWLRLSIRGKKWLSQSLEDQYRKLYESYRSTQIDSTYDDEFDDDDLDGPYQGRGYYQRSYGDSRFFGISISVHRNKGNQQRYYSYYTDMSDEVRKALRNSVLKAFETLPVGVYHRWDSVLNSLCSAKLNPLCLGGDLSKVVVFLNQRQVPRLPDPLMQASRLFLESFLLHRLIPFDAIRPAIDADGKLCVARLPRLAGYFGQTYDPGQDEISTSTKVIVQPDFSVLVIGLDPGPAVELAPFCDRAGGHAGQGALTFKITRESIVRAALQGLNAQAILGRLKKYASIDVPTNVINEVSEWAGWVRQVNVRPITVIRCPDASTVARVVSALGKKAERLSDSLVALNTASLAPAERQKLQDQGILITKQDITIIRPDNPVASAPPTAPVTPSKKRGRPKKAR